MHTQTPAHTHTCTHKHTSALTIGHAYMFADRHRHTHKHAQRDRQTDRSAWADLVDCRLALRMGGCGRGSSWMRSLVKITHCPTGHIGDHQFSTSVDPVQHLCCARSDQGRRRKWQGAGENRMPRRRSGSTGSKSAKGPSEVVWSLR